MAGVLTKYSSFVPKIINIASSTIVPLKRQNNSKTRDDVCSLFSLERLRKKDSRFQKCHIGKNPSFAEGGVCPRGADVLVSLIFGFIGQEIFGPKT